MKTNYVIAIIVVVVLVIIGMIVFVVSSREQAPSDGAEVDEAEGFGAQFGGGSESVERATESIPEVNPLGEAKTNPFENYKNPFGQ